MFCCRRSKSLQDEETTEQNKDWRTRNRELYLQRNGVSNGKSDGKLNAKNLNHITKDNANMLKPNVKHVTNVQNDIYVRLNGIQRHRGDSKTIGYLEGHYQVIHIPKQHSAAVRQAPKRAPIYKLDLSSSERADTRQTETTKDTMRLSTEFKVSSEENRTSTPFGMLEGGIKLSNDEVLAMFDNKDAESFTDEQRKALEHLEDTLNGYQTDDDESPIIVADVLPYGVFEKLKIDPSPPESSEDEPSSRNSSLSNKSVSSRTGIISQSRHSLGSKKNRNSVSFQLPIDHVDKPYAPMQTCAKPKLVSIQIAPPAKEAVTPPPAICISGNDVNIWHAGNTVYVEDKHQRRMSGPFKGSFQQLFYRKYNDADLSSYNESKTYLTPTIMEKVASFENLSDEHVPAKYRGSTRGNTAVVRRNTIR